MTIPTVWITGTVGAGKTTLAEAISNMIEAAGIRHGLISTDWLGQLVPFLPDDPFAGKFTARNLAAIWPNYIEQGVRHMVVEGVIETPVMKEAFVEALPGADVTVVRVRSPQTLINERITERETGFYKERLLARSAELTPILEAAALEDFTVDNDGRDIDIVASAVLDHLGWDI